MIKNIVFDMGNVLVEFSADKIMRAFGVEDSDRELIVRRVFATSLWTSLDRGTVTQEQAEAQMCLRLPERLHKAVHDILYDWWNRAMCPVAGMEELIRELKDKGYGIYLLSNATLMQPEYFHLIPGSEYFDGRVTSAEYKLLKPEHEIYETLFEKYSLRPEECFFVDDVPGNIEAGERLGMRGAVFWQKNMSWLREDMREAGIDVSE